MSVSEGGATGKGVPSPVLTVKESHGDRGGYGRHNGRDGYSDRVQVVVSSGVTRMEISLGGDSVNCFHHVLVWTQCTRTQMCPDRNCPWNSIDI